MRVKTMLTCPHCAAEIEQLDDGITYCDGCRRWLANRNAEMQNKIDEFWRKR